MKSYSLQVFTSSSKQDCHKMNSGTNLACVIDALSEVKVGKREEKVRLFAYLYPVRKASVQNSKYSFGKRVAKTLALIIIFGIIAAPVILTNFMGIGISPILTGSMRPYAKPGDLFITSSIPVSRVHIGDVLALKEQRTGIFYSHRVTQISTRGGGIAFTTKGDANNSIDPDVYVASSPKEEVAHVIARVRWVGRPLVFISSVQGKAVGVIFIVIANILGLFVFLFREPIGQYLLKERVYKDLYMEERRNNEQYREIIESMRNDPLNNLGENPDIAIEMEIIR